MSTVSGTLNQAVVAGGRIYSAGTPATSDLLKAIPEPEFWDGLTADSGTSTSTGGSGSGEKASEAEQAYLAKKKDELEAEVATRNESRDDDSKIVVPDPGNKPELAKALVADDEKTAGGE